MSLQLSSLEALMQVRTEMREEPSLFASGSLFSSLNLETASRRPTIARRKKKVSKDVLCLSQQAPEQPPSTSLGNLAKVPAKPEVPNLNKIPRPMARTDSSSEEEASTAPPGKESFLTQGRSGRELPEVTLSSQVLFDALCIEFNQRAAAYRRKNRVASADDGSGSEDSDSTATPSSTPYETEACGTVDSLPEL